MIVRNFFLWLFMATASLLTCAVGAQSGDGWRHIRTVGRIDMVLIDRARDKDKDVYRLAIGSICGPKLTSGFCMVLFWSDPTMVPRSMPMSVAQTRANRATWTFNSHTGYRQLLWACDIEPDPTQCFSQ